MSITAGELTRYEELIASRVATDALTGLPTRAAFERRVSEEIYRSTRTHGPLSIAIIDVDQIDQVNDRFGRAAGDAILRTFADQLRKTMRMSDAVFRYGSDEFALVLADTNVSTAYLACERLRAALAGVRHDGHRVVVSVGIAELTPGRTTEELIAKGEIALFRAKESGGNQSWRSDDPRRRGISPSSLSEDLTEREWDVLTHLAHRRTEQEIGRRLGISAGTVRSHKARIRRKLDVPPDIRLGDFVKTNLHDLVSRLGTIEDDGKVAEE